MTRKTLLLSAVALAAIGVAPAAQASDDMSCTGASCQGLAGVSTVAHALRQSSQFSPRGFSFSINYNGTIIPLFSGISGVRQFNDYDLLNNWLELPSTLDSSRSVYDGGAYQFTYGALGSYFGSGSDSGATGSTGGSVTPQAYMTYISAPPVPEPASWLMVIVGFGLLGGIVRHVRARKVSFS